MDAFLSLSGWAMGLLGLVYTLIQEVRLRRERAERQLLSDLLARSAQGGVVHVSGDSLRSHAPTIMREADRLKSLLISAAASNRDVASVLKTAGGEGFNRAQVVQALESLHDVGLLTFSLPLTDASAISLER